MAEFVVHSLLTNNERCFKYFPDIGRKKTKDCKALPDNKGNNSRKRRREIFVRLSAKKMNRAEVRRERKKRDKPQPCLWATFKYNTNLYNAILFLPEIVHSGENYLMKATLKVKVQTIVLILSSVKYNIKIFLDRQPYFDCEN
jgi:hypothetical protein